MRNRWNDSLAVIAAILAFSAVSFAQTYGTPGYAPGTWKPQEVPKDLSKPKPYNPRDLSGVWSSPDQGRVISKGMPSTTSGCPSRIRASPIR